MICLTFANGYTVTAANDGNSYLGICTLDDSAPVRITCSSSEELIDKLHLISLQKRSFEVKQEQSA